MDTCGSPPTVAPSIGAWADLKSLHKGLDESVAACYGWPKSVAQDDAEIVRLFTALNEEITEGRRDYAPFGTVGELV